MSEHKHVIKFDVKTYPCKCGLEFSQELAETLVEAALSGSLPTVQLGIDLEFEKRKVVELEAEVTKCHELQDSYCDRIAELEADKERLNSCESALISMVNQFFYSKDDENILRHSFMSAEEEAAEYLVEHGIARWAGKNKSAICFNEVQE